MPTTRHRAGVAALALAVVTCSLAVGSGAPAGGAEQLSIRKVDASDFPVVRVAALFAGPRPDIAGVAVRENGRLVEDLDVVPVGQSTTPLGIVLVIDTSGSMAAGGRLDQAKIAARGFVERKLPNDQIALVAFSNSPRVAVNFTDDPGLLTAAIEGLAPSGETALWDAVRLGANLFADRSDLLPYLVVLSDGADTVSGSGPEDALGAVRGAQAGVFSIAITGPGDSDVPALRALADSTGGDFAETADARQLAAVYENLQRVLQNQYELTWTSKASASPLEIGLKIGSASATASVPFNSVSLGSVAQPRAVEIPTTPAPLAGPLGPVVVAVLAALAAAAAGVAVLAFRREGRGLEEVLRAYSAGAPDPVRAEQAERGMVPDSLRRAVETTARLAGGTGALARLDTKLEQADLKIKAQEGVLFFGAGLTLLTVVVFVAGGPVLGLAAAVVGALAPIAILNLLAERRRGAFTKQLPDTLQLLASSLRAGYSLLQGLDAVAEEVADPMGRELRRVVLETRLGRELELSLEDLAGRMGSPDFEWVVMAIRIQREVGGNLAELLSSVSETMVSRERLRREVSALTAEGRLSAIIVGALPLVIGVAITVLNPGYINILFTTTLGRLMILAAVLLTVAGFWWMKKVIQIDV
ncbi:MAG: type II secretion system F family protein [Actinobacteria bacterium]|nr:type II secretion system F family protein [Actinomycetota bacterium]